MSLPKLVPSTRTSISEIDPSSDPDPGSEGSGSLAASPGPRVQVSRPTIGSHLRFDRLRVFADEARDSEKLRRSGRSNMPSHPDRFDSRAARCDAGRFRTSRELTRQARRPASPDKYELHSPQLAERRCPRRCQSGPDGAVATSDAPAASPAATSAAPAAQDSEELRVEATLAEEG